MDTSIDFSHTADTGDNERVFLVSSQVDSRHISSGGLQVKDKSKELDSMSLVVEIVLQTSLIENMN